MSADEQTTDVVRDIRQRKHVTVPRPHVPFGPEGIPPNEADADYMRSAARNIVHSRCLGSNLTATVVDLLNAVADQVEQLDDPCFCRAVPNGDGSGCKRPGCPRAQADPKEVGRG